MLLSPRACSPTLTLAAEPCSLPRLSKVSGPCSLYGGLVVGSQRVISFRVLKILYVEEMPKYNLASHTKAHIYTNVH